MSREVKRVALDFDWPLEKVWKGYVNPHFKACTAPDCHGGETAASAWVLAISRFLALIGEQAASAPHADELRQRGQIYPHPYLDEWPQAPRDREPKELTDALDAAGDDEARRRRVYQDYWRHHEPKLMPMTEELRLFVSGLAGQSIEGSLLANPEFDIYKKLLKAAGIKAKNWGSCATCAGTGLHPSVKEAHDSWKPAEPPAGEGWQLWETVSEGSPISPVFATSAEFVNYLVGQGYTRKAAEGFMKSGWAPTGMMAQGKMYNDIEIYEMDEP